MTKGVKQCVEIPLVLAWSLSENLPGNERPSLTGEDKNKMVHLGKIWSVKENNMITVTCLLITEDKH